MPLLDLDARVITTSVSCVLVLFMTRSKITASLRKFLHSLNDLDPPYGPYHQCAFSWMIHRHEYTPPNSSTLGSVTFGLEFDQKAEPEPAVWFGVRRICQRTGLSRTLAGLESAGDNCTCIHIRWRRDTLGLVEKLKGDVLPSMILIYLNQRPVPCRRFLPCYNYLVVQHRYKLYKVRGQGQILQILFVQPGHVTSPN